MGYVDWSFILTLLVIVAGGLVGSYLRSSRKDRCLEDFDGFHVTVEKKNGRVIWGVMHLTSTGFELEYRSDVQDDKHLETSYIFYQDEFADIQAIYRYVRDLTDEKANERAKSIEKSLHPRLPRRLGRSFRNFMSTATDSAGDALGLLIGRAKRPAATVITDTSESYLNAIGKNLIGYVGTDSDPLLERHIGTRVVMEVVEEEELHEHVGIFKDYSAAFLEALDVYYPLPTKVSLTEEACHSVFDRVEVSAEGRQVRVRNTQDQPVYVESIQVAGQAKELNAIVAGGEEIMLNLDKPDTEITLLLRVACRLDMIVPRGHALIRHRAERYDPDTIFDLGWSIVRRDGDLKEAERLRQVLRYTPHDAMSAAKLGEILYRRGEVAEAQKWLALAWQHRRHLPDNGNRVAQHLRTLERRAPQLGGLPSGAGAPDQAALVSINGDGAEAKVELVDAEQ